MSAGFGAVAAGFHRAPAPAVVLGLVDEQVATTPVILAFANPANPAGGQQVCCCPRNGPQDQVGRLEVGWKLPAIFTTQRGEL